MSKNVAIAIHGGAGVMAERSAEEEKQIREALDAALESGYTVLLSGGSALDAVTASVITLKECPFFNAGKGAVFNAEGGHELDASVMEGHTRRAGAVAGVKTVRNPILLARAVMERSPHVMLAGEGAERFADEQKDIERVPNEWFSTDFRRSHWGKVKLEEMLEQHQAASGPSNEGNADDDKKSTLLQTESRLGASSPTSSSGSEQQQRPNFRYGTVGAVALDRAGHLAAATSTGGMTNKKWSRVGDSPVIGAGTYATDECAVSGTGWGEFYLRTAAAHQICARVSLAKQSLAEAADAVILKEIPALGGDGGAIAVDKHGNLALPFCTPGMYRGWINADGSRGVAIHSESVEAALVQKQS